MCSPRLSQWTYTGGTWEIGADLVILHLSRSIRPIPTVPSHPPHPSSFKRYHSEHTGWNSCGCSICANAIGGDWGSWAWNQRGLLAYAWTLRMAVGIGESIVMWQCISRRCWLTSPVAITGSSRSCRIVWQAGGQSKSGDRLARLIDLRLKERNPEKSSHDIRI